MNPYEELERRSSLTSEQRATEDSRQWMYSLGVVAIWTGLLAISVLTGFVEHYLGS